MRESGQQPWFIWYGIFLPHTPHNPPQKLLDKYLPVAPSRAVARYWANCEWLDRGIGEILEFLEDAGELDNTLIVYTCDNGWIQDPARPQRFDERSKRTAYEGGIRTPIMLALPGKIDPLMDRTHLASNLDLWPTIAQLTGSDYPQHLTGIDLTDRRAVTQRDTLYGASYQHDMQDYGNPAASLKKRFVIQNFWKLLQPHQANPAPELYDLKADPWERQNLAGQHPDLMDELTEKIDRWWTP